MVAEWLDIAVVGAHLTGMPLHHELLARGAELQAVTRTAPSYRLYALAGGPPERPGLVRVDAKGCCIAVEVHRLPMAEVGRLLAAVPAPLAIGTVELESEDAVHGFLCESAGLSGARDISEFGGWRAYSEFGGR